MTQICINHKSAELREYLIKSEQNTTHFLGNKRMRIKKLKISLKEKRSLKFSQKGNLCHFETYKNGYYQNLSVVPKGIHKIDQKKWLCQIKLKILKQTF